MTAEPRLMDVNSLVTADAVGRLKTSFQQAQRASHSGEGIGIEDFVAILLPAARKMRKGATEGTRGAAARATVRPLPAPC